MIFVIVVTFKLYIHATNSSTLLDLKKIEIEKCKKACNVLKTFLITIYVD